MGNKRKWVTIYTDPCPRLKVIGRNIKKETYKLYSLTRPYTHIYCEKWDLYDGHDQREACPADKAQMAI